MICYWATQDDKVKVLFKANEVGVSEVRGTLLGSLSKEILGTLSPKP